ncbi:hypothetical protein BKA62DRAFT_611293 [Auriculariales sp. MPI-PUGE-AT-0066]|nr:hypothetical protein BKA62DRAFT_611293 [Auriculariales sp. MPI-PUGE-AT-0066]
MFSFLALWYAPSTSYTTSWRKETSATTTSTSKDDQAWRQLLQSVRESDQPRPASSSRRSSRLGVFDDIFVVSLKKREDRRTKLDTVRRALGLEWTYVYATEGGDPGVSRILDQLRSVRANHTAKDFVWPRVVIPPTATPDAPFPMAGAELWSLDPSDPRAPAPVSPSKSKGSNGNEWLPETFVGDYTAFAPGKGTLMNRPRIATFLSHMHLVRRIADAPSPDYAALILEDDVDIDWHAEQRLRRLWEAQALPKDWDMLYLGHCPPIAKDDARTSEAHFQPLNGAPGVRPSYGPWCTHAYALSRDGARRVLTQLRYELFAFSRPVDNAYVHLVLNKRVKSFTFLPPLVVQMRDGVSDIWGLDMTGLDVTKDDLEDSTLERIALASKQEQSAADTLDLRT